MAELKAGGLAIIVKSRVGENVGKTVILTRHLGVMKGNTMNVSHDSWEVKSANGEKLKGYLPDGSVVSWTCVFCPSAWLLPIDGDDFQHEDERKKELTHG